MKKTYIMAKRVCTIKRWYHDVIYHAGHERARPLARLYDFDKMREEERIKEIQIAYNRLDKRNRMKYPEIYKRREAEGEGDTHWKIMGVKALDTIKGYYIYEVTYDELRHGKMEE